MSTWVVVSQPQGAIDEGLLAQAKRSLGAPVRAGAAPVTSTDRAIGGLLAARAARIAIDALDDGRAKVSVGRIQVRGIEITKPPTEPRLGPTVAVALHEVGSDRVQVRFVPMPEGDSESARLAEAERASDAACAATAELAFERISSVPGAEPSAPHDAGDIVVQRFTHGPDATRAGTDVPSLNREPTRS